MKGLQLKVLLKLLGLSLGLGLFAKEQAYNLKDPIFDPANVTPSALTVSNLIDFGEIPINYDTGHCLLFSALPILRKACLSGTAPMNNTRIFWTKNAKEVAATSENYNFHRSDSNIFGR